MSHVLSAVAAMLLVVNGVVSAGGICAGNASAPSGNNVVLPSRASGLYSRYPNSSYRPGASVFYSPVNGADYRYRRTCPYKHWHFLQDDIILGVFRDFGR